MVEDVGCRHPASQLDPRCAGSLLANDIRQHLAVGEWQLPCFAIESVRMIVPEVRSTSFQRSPKISPRRQPVSQAKRTALTACVGEVW
jgi:hypothetical protein